MRKRAALSATANSGNRIARPRVTSRRSPVRTKPREEDRNGFTRRTLCVRPRESRETPVAILGLQIASYTYGGLLGLFLLGRFKGEFHPATLIAGLLSAAAVVLWLRNMGIAWTWYIVVATAANMGVAWGLNALYSQVMARRGQVDG